MSTSPDGERPNDEQTAIAAATDLLEALVAVSSPTGDRRGLERAVEILGDALAARGLAVEVLSEAAHDDDGESHGGELLPVLLARGPAAERQALLVVGHLDTVLPATPSVRRDGRLYAAGACDMKGGLAALVGALDLLRARGRRGPEDLLVAVVPDEEVMGPICRRVTRRLGATARGLWVLEPGESRGDGVETVVTGRRGMLQWRLEARGTGAHAGNDYWRGRSALLAAAAWCQAAVALASPGRGPTVSPARLVAGDTAFVDGLAAGEAALLGSPRRLNVIPDRAVVEGEARFLRAMEGARLRKELAAQARRLADERGVEMTFTVTAEAPPVDPDGPGRPWAERAVTLAARRGLRLRLDDARGGLSFPNFLADPAAIPVLDGLGPTGGGMHTPQEFVDLASLGRRVLLLADLLAADADADGEETGAATPAALRRELRAGR